MMISEASEEQLRHYMLRGAWPQVSNLCQRLLPSTKDKRLYALLGKALVHQGQTDAAIEAYLQGLKLQYDQPESHYILATLYKKQQKKALAVCHYQQALRYAPSSRKAALELAKLFYQLGDSKQAFRECQKIVEADPSCAEAHFIIGLLYEQKGEEILAIKSYRQTLFIQPDYARGFRHLGAALVRLEAYEAAVDVYQQAIALYSTQAHKSSIHESSNSVQNSDTQNEQSNENPNLAAFYSGLGQVYQHQDKLQQAIAAYQKALAIDPTLAVAHRNLGHISRSAQAIPQALSHFKSATEHATGKTYIAAASDYAWTLASSGQWDKLLQCFRQAVETESDFAIAYSQRVQSLLGDDLLFKLQRASGVLLEMLLSGCTTAVLKPQLSLVYEQLAKLSAACGAMARAEQCYRHALSLSPNTLHLYQALGDNLQSQGRYSGAIAIYQAGLLQAQLTSTTPTCSVDNLFSLDGLAEPPAEKLTVKTSTNLSTNLSIKDCSTDLPNSSLETNTLKTSVYPPLNNWIKTQLKERIKQATAAQTQKPIILIKGVYTKAKDWLAASRLNDDQSETKTKPLQPTDPKPTDSKPAGPKPVDLEAVAPKCGGLTCQRCMTNLIRKFSPVQVADSAFRCGASQVKTDNTSFFPSQFALTIPHGRAWIAPKKNNWTVCNEIAIFSPDNFLLNDLSRCYPWYLPGCPRHRASSHSLFERQRALPPVQKLPGKVAVLSGLSGHIYYHWLFDVLPRIGVLETALEQENSRLEDIDYFVVNSIQAPFQRETLQRLGIPIEKVIESDHTPHFQAEKLVVPSFAGALDWVPQSSLHFLRRAFLEKVKENPRENSTSNQSQNHTEKTQTSSKRIYVSRTNAKYRQIFNEAEVMELLGHFGFVSVVLETLSVAQQTKLFAEAEVIVAAHGSGLANLAFCSSDTKVIELFSPNYLRTDYWMISEYLQLQHYYLVGQSFEFHPLRQLMYPSGLTEDFSVDLTALRSLLTQIGIQIKQVTNKTSNK